MDHEERKKALIISTISGFLPQFEMNNATILMEYGYEVHYASNFRMPMYGEGNERLDEKVIKRHQIDFVRSPYQIRENIKAYEQLKKLKNSCKFSVVHCHTPMGAVLGRLAFRKEKDVKIIYTAHGFHFYKQAPLQNWLFYYPIEKVLSSYTDVLITINREDFSLARKKFRVKKIVRIPGVGVPVDKIQRIAVNREKTRELLGIKDEDFVLISVGELNRNKNHQVVLRALGKLKEKKLHYLICGKGEQRENLVALTKELGLEGQVHFLGYRTDVVELCKASDCFVFPSKREGLGIAALEGMACGLPLISSNSGGIKDYSKNGITGYCVDYSDEDGFRRSIAELMNHPEHCRAMGEYNKNAVKEFDISNTEKIMRQVYKELKK